MRQREQIDPKSLRTLSPKEFEIMNLYWKTEEPLSRADLAEAAPDLNRNTLHVLLPRLVKDKFLRTARIIQTPTVLTRAYRPTISRVDYLAKELGYETTELMLIDFVEKTLENGQNSGLKASLEQILKKWE